MEYKNIESYLAARNMSREELKEVVMDACFNLLLHCEQNFDGSPNVTQEVAEPLYILNKLLEEVE